MFTKRIGSQQGFVLVTSLLILVVLAVLGSSAFFLTMMNLRIAENTRSSAVAQANAYEGVDVALIVLAREYRLGHGERWPTLADFQELFPEGGPFTITGLDFDTLDASSFPLAGTVTVRGFGPRGAEYESSARFEGARTPVPIPPGADPLFGYGLVTPHNIGAPGGASADFGMSMWAGGSIGGNFRVVKGQQALSGVGETCKIHPQSDTSCLESPPPAPPAFDFEEGLAEFREEREGECTVTVTRNGPVDASFLAEGSTVCLAPNVTATITGTATDLYVLGPITSTVVYSATSRAPAGGGPSLKIAAGNVVFGETAVFGGMISVYSASDVVLTGVRSAIGESIALIATEASLYIPSGGKKTSTILNAILWVNGSACKHGNGGLDLNGSIVALGQSDQVSSCPSRDRGIYWNGVGGATFSYDEHPDIPPSDPGDEDQAFDAAGIRVLAKRP